MLVLGYGISELDEERQRMDLFGTYQDCFGFHIKRCMSCTRIRIRIQEISLEYSLEGLMLKLKLQYFGYLMRRTDSLEKTLMLGKMEGRRRRGQQDEMVGWHHRLDGHEFEQALEVGDGQGSKELDTTEQLN